MSENVNPEQPGHESLSVEQAADRFLTILNPEEASTDQPQEEESVVEKTEIQSELEAAAEDLEETETLEQDSEEPLQEETPQLMSEKKLNSQSKFYSKNFKRQQMPNKFEILMLKDCNYWNKVLFSKIKQKI